MSLVAGSRALAIVPLVIFEASRFARGTLGHSTRAGPRARARGGGDGLAPPSSAGFWAAATASLAAAATALTSSRRARSSARSARSSVSWPVTSASLDSSSAVALSPPNSSAGGSPSCCEASDADPRRARRDIGLRRRSGKGAASGRAAAKVRGLRTLTTQKAPSGARSGARAGQGLAKPLAAAAS